MTTPLAIRSVSDLQYDYALSAAYRSPWVYNPSGADSKDPDLWEIVRNQTDILAEVLRRNNQIVRPWRVTTNYHANWNKRDREVVDQSKRLAAICHEGISHCATLDESRILISEAFFVGRKYGMVLWEPVYTSLDGAPEMLWYLPYRIKDVDRRRVHYVPDWAWIKSDGTMAPAGSEITTPGAGTYSQIPHPRGGYLRMIGTHLEMFDQSQWTWKKIGPEQRRNLVEHVYYDEEDRVGHGRGVLEAGYFTHFFLTNTFKKIVEGIDRFANGIMIGKLDSLRNASSGKTNADMVTAMKNVMNTYRSEHYMILGENDKVEIVGPPSTGFDVSMQFVQHLTASWARLCNGSARPSGHSVDGTGSKAAAGVEEDTSEAYYQPDRNGLDHVFNRDLLGAFLYHNQDNIRAIGLDKAKRPKFSSAQIKRASPKDAIEVMSAVLAAGQPILRSEFFENVELTMPGDDDEVVEGQSAQMGMGGAGGIGGNWDDPAGNKPFGGGNGGGEKPDGGKPPKKPDSEESAK